MAEPDWKLVEIVTKWIEMGGTAGYGWKLLILAKNGLTT